MFFGCFVFAILSLTTTARDNESDNEKVDISANSKILTEIATRLNTEREYFLNSKVRFDSSRNFIKYLSTTNQRKRVVMKTNANSILSTQIIEGAIDSGRSKPSMAPTAKSTTRRPTISPTKAPRIAPTLLPTKKLLAPSVPPSLLPTKVVQSPSIASTKAPVKVPSPKSSTVPTNSITKSARPTCAAPSQIPSRRTLTPTLRGSPTPTARPSILKPSVKPSKIPSVKPSSKSPVRPPSINDNFQYYPNRRIMNGTVNLYNIYFGLFPRYPFLNSSQQTQPLVDYFSANLGSSSWYKTVTTYYQVNKDGSKTYASASVQLKKSVAYQPTARARTIPDDTVIANIIVSLLTSQQMPVDENGIYNVFFRGDFKYGGWIANANQGGWCGYHSNFALTDGRVLKFTVTGDPSTAPSDLQMNCAGIFVSANGNFGADSMVNILAHQIPEVVTNDDGAWNDGSDAPNGEIGDICEWDFQLDENSNANWNIIVGKMKFLVQSLYRVGYGCVLSCC